MLNGCDPRAVHLWLRAEDHERVRARLASLLGSDVEITSGSAAPAAHSCLLFSPHEFEPARRVEILRSHAWPWIHLSTAGYDFVPFDAVPGPAWVTRSWRAYAAPLAEYVSWALLRHAREVRGTGLRGSRVGLVGYGEVGRRIVALLRLMEVEGAVFTRAGVRDFDKHRVGTVRASAPGELQSVQHLVLAASLNSSSMGLVGAAFFETCPIGLHVVNVARGELVNQGALLHAVRTRDVWATLDVSVPEPLPQDHPLRHHPRVLITEHVAWRSGDEFPYLDDFLAARMAFSRGEEPRGVLRWPDPLARPLRGALSSASTGD
jgi:phosphoglycerate dehydrogenase-like enzyme